MTIRQVFHVGTLAMGRPFLIAAILLLLSATAGATTLTYSGTLPDQNDLFDVEFSLATTATVTMQTSGVPTGDFLPVLWLFNSTNTTQLDKNDPTALQNALMTEVNLAPGTYNLVLSTFDQHYCTANTACNGVTYANTGWSYNGNFFGRSPNFSVSITSTAALTDLTNSCSTTASNCFDPPTRAYQSAAIAPEPASAGLLLLGAGVLGFWRFRAARRQKRLS
jgi:PEP-CTERM motif